MTANARSRAVRKWERVAWPSKNGASVMLRLMVRAAKVAEEGGEVAGAAIKYSEGRKDLSDITDEMGDVYITLHALAAELDIDLEEVCHARWESVRHRQILRDNCPVCECGHGWEYHRRESMFPIPCLYRDCECPGLALPGTSWES